jgi:hypothetical protein
MDLEKEFKITPKEKALELWSKYYKVPRELYNDRFQREICKYYCFFCIDEIIKACEYNDVEVWNTNWWNDVRKEVEKLP